MAVIGLFTASKAGGWEGRICTLSINIRAKFTPNDNKHSEHAPDFYVTTLGCQIGAAWQRRPQNAGGKPFLSVQFDDPGLPGPVCAALFLNDDQHTASLVWKPHPAATER